MRDSYQTAVDTARAQLPLAEWEAAWAAGRAMALEQALAEAARSGDTVATNTALTQVAETTQAFRAIAPSPIITLLTPSGPVEIAHARLPATIGRVDSCDIMLDDTRVSRQHAWLILRDGQLLIRDQGSTNGTFVNGERVAEQALHDGDIISFGGLEITVQSTAVH